MPDFIITDTPEDLDQFINPYPEDVPLLDEQSIVDLYGEENIPDQDW